MNRKQIIVVWSAICLIVAALLNPPWQFRSSGSDVYETMKHRSVFKGSPKLVTYNRETDFWSPKVGEGRIDLGRLILPIQAIILVAVGLLITFRDRKPPIARN